MPISCNTLPELKSVGGLDLGRNPKNAVWLTELLDKGAVSLVQLLVKLLGKPFSPLLIKPP